MSEQQNVKYKYSGDTDKLGYIAELAADNARLREAIEEAPHELMCNTSTFGKWDITIKNKECNCWKRNALEGE